MELGKERDVGSTGFAPGWHEGVDVARYLSDPAVSAGALWRLHEDTPAHLLAELRAGRAATKATDLGDLVHAAVFEPAKFGSHYVVIGQCEAIKKGDGERCTNAGSVIRDGRSYCQTKSHDPLPGAPMDGDLYPVAAALRDDALAMLKALLAHPTANDLLTAEGPREVTGVWRDQRTGLWCRIRPDALIHQPAGTRPVYHWSQVDLKSTGRSAAPSRFPKQSEALGHYFRAAFYRMGLRELWDVEPQNFFYPVVESDGSHQVIVYRLNENALDVGEAEVRQALDRLAECVSSGRWPGYGPEIHDLGLSDWRMKQVHDVDFLEVA